MIRNVPIPTTVPRMGCSPGGDCCSDCAAQTAAAPAIAGPSSGNGLIFWLIGAGLLMAMAKKR